MQNPFIHRPSAVALELRYFPGITSPVSLLLGDAGHYHYTPYSARMSPENTYKLMGFYMDVLILGITH